MATWQLPGPSGLPYFSQFYFAVSSVKVYSSITKIYFAYSVCLSDLDELSDSKRIIRVFIWMLDKTQLSVCLLDIFHFSIWLDPENLEGIEGLERLDLADLISSECPDTPEKQDENNLNIEALAHPFLRVYLLSLLDDLLAADTLTIIRIIEFFVDFSRDHFLYDAECQRHEDHCQDRDEEVVECTVIVVKELLLVSVEIILET